MLDFNLAHKDSAWYGSAQLGFIYIVRLQGCRNTDPSGLMAIQRKWLNMNL